MNVLFRVDASPVIGMGHLMRCLALAQALVSSQLHLIFAVSKSTLKLCKNRHDWVGEILVVPEYTEVSEEILWLDGVVKEHEIAAFVLDGYQFPQDYRQKLAGLPCAKILFDDNNNSGYLHADLVINGAENAELMGYQHSAPDAVYCLGNNYRILRQEFIIASPNKWENRHLLTISLGGSDPKNLTIALLEALNKQNIKASVCVITGGAYQQLVELKAVIAHSHLDIKHIHDCQNMADIFSQSKLVVSAAGGTQFELLACQTPSLLLVVADNQLNATEQASQQGWCDMVDVREEVDSNFLSQQIANLWNDNEQLKLMATVAKNYKNVDGAQRVVAAIIDLVEAKNNMIEGS